MSMDVLPNVQGSSTSIVINLLFAVIPVAIIIGIWRYRYWAWFAVMLFTGIALILAIWKYFNGGSPYFELLINSLVVLYLNQRETRESFERRRQEVTI
jgi:uncharacterized membrane protein (DUF2068 family)